jgi:hypothetical protein
MDPVKEKLWTELPVLCWHLIATITKIDHKKTKPWQTFMTIGWLTVNMERKKQKQMKQVLFT